MLLASPARGSARVGLRPGNRGLLHAAGLDPVFLSVVPLAVYLCLLGRQVVRHRQLPPPGMKVIVDIRVVEGDRAVTRGRIVMALAVALLAVGLLGGLWLPYRLERVFAGRLKQAPAESARQSEAAEQPSDDTAR